MKYSVFDGSSVENIMDKHSVFLRQLHRLGYTAGVYFHLLYYYNPDKSIPKGNHLSIIFYATSKDKERLDGIREFLTTSVLSNYYNFYCYEVATSFSVEDEQLADGTSIPVLKLKNISGETKMYSLGGTRIGEINEAKSKTVLDISGQLTPDATDKWFSGVGTFTVQKPNTLLGTLGYPGVSDNLNLSTVGNMTVEVTPTSDVLKDFTVRFGEGENAIALTGSITQTTGGAQPSWQVHLGTNTFNPADWQEYWQLLGWDDLGVDKKYPDVFFQLKAQSVPYLKETIKDIQIFEKYLHLKERLKERYKIKFDDWISWNFIKTQITNKFIKLNLWSKCSKKSPFQMDSLSI
jgi:hypothetical protein